jgi:mRNA interferase RelE/StbE
MTYELLFHPDALEEWGKLDKPVREQFKKKLAERLLNPHVPSAKLSGQKSRYKIKLRSAGYRLVYDVVDAQLIVTVVAVGKRERNAVYKAAASR